MSTRKKMPPRGVDMIQDIACCLPICDIDIVFDVGANVGQSTEFYLVQFPKSHIYCFEPVKDTYHQLHGNLKQNPRVDCFQLAFGASQGQGKMVLAGRSETFFVLEQSKEFTVEDDVKTEPVDIVTLDEFCQERSIHQINYLKIDTEGGDLEVLKGAEHLLSAQKIDIVQVEAGMNPSNDRHVPLETLKAFLESRRYFLFGIYEQVNEWPTKSPHLRRANPLFISDRLIERNKAIGVSYYDYYD